MVSGEHGFVLNSILNVVGMVYFPKYISVLDIDVNKCGHFLNSIDPVVLIDIRCHGNKFWTLLIRCIFV
jgi:hypothetical protein